MLTFEQWLEHEYPHHSHYDFNTLGEYDAWKSQLKTAFEAGQKNAK